VPPSSRIAQLHSGLVDGEWHRLHPLTPLLRGGVAIIAVLGVIIANLRERIIDFFVHMPEYGGDPIDEIYSRGLTGWALLAVSAVILLAIGAFYLAWRMQTYRVGDDAVELRSGIFSRSHRKARLDRIQGINVHRPLLARIVGAAKLEIVVAGHDANLHLAYLGSQSAEQLRREILRLASGARATAASAGAPESGASGAGASQAGAPGAEASQVGAPGPSGASAAVAPGAGRLSDVIVNRVDEFISPADLDPDAAAPESIVKMHPGRLAGSLIFSGVTVILLLVLAAIIAGAATGRFWLLLAILPGVLGAFGFYTRRFSKALRYSISGSPDGVRVGFGLLTTSSETIPPGRIHAVEILQPLLWRPFGWWQVRINTAGHSRQKGAAGEANTTTLPVGSARDVERVLPLLLPGMDDAVREGIARAGMSRTSDQSIFSVAPRRARWLRPFSWRRTGYAIADGTVVLRHGAVWRRIMFVPLARLQSVKIEQGPVHRLLGLSAAAVHTVDGPVHARLSVIGVDDALTFFEFVSAGAVDWAARDTSKHWKAS
jgi:Predicted membrane protein